MVKVPYRGVPKKDTVEVKGEGEAPPPPIRRAVRTAGEGEAGQRPPPIRRAVRTAGESDG